jgi:hypothetical protein
MRRRIVKIRKSEREAPIVETWFRATGGKTLTRDLI